MVSVAVEKRMRTEAEMMVSVVEKRMRREWSDSENCCFLRDLGDDLLVEILIRLPSKTAVRCKTVCKKWRSVIGERGFFIRRYIHHRHDLQVSLKCMSLVYQITSEYFVPYLPDSPPAKVPEWVFEVHPAKMPEWLFEINIATENPVVRKLYKDGVVDMTFLPCVQQPFPSILPNERADFRLVASCAELLVCSYNNTSTSTSTMTTVYYICNVATKKWVALPPIPTCLMDSDVGLLCDPMSCPDCDLEFNTSYNYKLVRIPLASAYNRFSLVSELEIQIFCSKEGQWRNSTLSLSRIVKAPRLTNRVIAYNRMLHWLTDDGVVAFDPFCERVFSRIIDLPPGAYINSEHCCFGVSRGRLCLGIVSRSRSEAANNLMLLVWELVDYHNVNVEWRLALRICNVRSLLRGLGVKGSFRRLSILDFHPYARDILYLSVGKYIVKCNARQENKSKVLHQVIVPSDSRRVEFCWPRAFTLVHDFWPTPVPAVP